MWFECLKTYTTMPIPISFLFLYSMITPRRDAYPQPTNLILHSIKSGLCIVTRVLKDNLSGVSSLRMSFFEANTISGSTTRQFLYKSKSVVGGKESLQLSLELSNIL